MDKSSIEVGNTLTTEKSKVTGVVKEIVANANGSLRVRLDVNGQDRWTTVKQSSQGVSVIKRLTACIPLVATLDVWGLDTKLRQVTGKAHKPLTITK